ncbi:MAG: hypothetical protein RL094_170 [Candidatus Parcubacteria bacterium]|jgi:prepilin-type N-terminal cleavage/methylation domain-containing protein
MKRSISRNQKGFTLIETLISIGIFAGLALTVYSTSTLIIKLAGVYRENTTISNLAAQYMEIVRNLPYSQVGTVNGNPTGILVDLPNATSTSYNNITYQIYYESSFVDDPADGTIASSTDPAPTDYKQVKLNIKNTRTNVVTTFVTNITPAGLENTNNAGAFTVQVFDAVGQPVPGAQINITNTALTPDINITRTTDANGYWTEVGLPQSSNNYHVTATKTGYSSDQTYPVSVGNPNPTKPDATILNGTVTQISFSIDKLSNLTFNTLNQSCAPLSNVGIGVKGAKIIGTPSVYKFNNTYTSNGSGQVVLSNIEWDNYTPALSTSSYMIYGSSPIQQINILPQTSQNFNLIVGPITTNSLLVIVKDAATGVAIEGANVRLTRSGYDDTLITGGSAFSQQDWTGGVGQANMGTSTMYFSNDGNIDTATLPTGVRLKKTFGVYSSSGWLQSSTFDSGSTSTLYTTLNWEPQSQTASTTLRFQIASSNDGSTTTWNFLGPDGASTTYYTVPGTSISSVHNNNRYLRYKAYLSNSTTTVTPVLTSLDVNYVSGCFTPGQVMFPGLSAANDYQVQTSMTGYTTKTVTNLNISGYNVLTVLLSS